MRFVVLCIALCAAGCGEAPRTRPTLPMGSASSAPAVPPAWRRSCSRPGEPAAKLEYRDAPGGASIVYTTPGDPTYLRERVTDVARYHNHPRPLTAMHDLADVPHTASVEHIEHGVILTLFASARQHMEELRIQVQQDVWIKQRRGCSAGQEAL